MRRLNLLMLVAFLMSSLSYVWAADPVVLYTFKEGSGDIVRDVSGVGKPLDLTIAEPGDVDWIVGGGLSVNSKNLVASPAPATKIIEACMATNEITVELKIKAANTTQGGPARAVTLSEDSLNRNFTIGPLETFYEARVRTTVTSDNGNVPALFSPAGAVTTELSHVFYTRDISGNAKFYLNGEELAPGVYEGRDSSTGSDILGDFSIWDETYQFALGDELSEGRPWLGEYYLVAVYSSALTLDEIQLRTFAVEPRGKLPVTWAEIKAIR